VTSTLNFSLVCLTINHTTTNVTVKTLFDIIPTNNNYLLDRPLKYDGLPVLTVSGLLWPCSHLIVHLIGHLMGHLMGHLIWCVSLKASVSNIISIQFMLYHYLVTSV